MRYREILEAIDNDDDMFSAPGALATGAKQAIKQIENPYLRTVHRVRELAKTKFGIKTRVSSVPKSASRGRATFWFGDYVRDSNDPYDKAPEAPPVAQEIKAELERQGFECKFTGSGWLSVLVPPAYSDLLREENDESDDELFGDGQQKAFVVTAPDDEILGMFDNIREAIAHAKEQIPSYLEAGWGDDDFITVYKQNWNEESGVPVAYYPITDNPIDENDDSDDDLFAAPTLRFDDAFNEYDEDELQKQGFSYGEDPARDVDIINDYLEGYKNYRVVKLTGGGGMGTDDLVLHLNSSSQLGEEESDDEMFGVSGSAAQRMIYKFGKQMLAKLEQAYNNSHVKAEYEKLTQGEEPDANRLFDLVCRSTSTPFGKAMVVDSILREYAGGFNGLNDFGTLIDSGEWQNDIVDMWDMFGNDPDVAQQDWFQKEIQTFMGDR